MAPGTATLIYNGVLSGEAIKDAVDTAADGISGEGFVVVPNINNNAVCIVHVEGTP